MRNLDQLVSDAVAGDRLAFARLLEGETPTAYRAALAILRSPEEARDVVQEAAIRAWQQLPDLRRANAWPGWFRRITVRMALDELRHSRHGREIRLTEEANPGTEDPTVGADETIALLAAFERLPAADRAILALRFQLDLTVPDVAATLGIRVGTAKARLHRAVVRLRGEFRDDVS